MNNTAFWHCVKRVQALRFFWFVFFLVRVRSVKDTDQKKLSISTLFTQCNVVKMSVVYGQIVHWKWILFLKWAGMIFSVSKFWKIKIVIKNPIFLTNGVFFAKFEENDCFPQSRERNWLQWSYRSVNPKKLNNKCSKLCFFHKIRGKEAFCKAIYSTEHKFCTKMECNDVCGR